MLACDNECKTCEGPNQCKICKNPLFEVNIYGACTCPSGSYYSVDTCKSCSSHCSICSGPKKNQCTLYKTGYQLNSLTAECECSPGFYEFHSDKKKCESPCECVHALKISLNIMRAFSIWSFDYCISLFHLLFVIMLQQPIAICSNNSKNNFKKCIWMHVRCCMTVIAVGCLKIMEVLEREN